MAPLKVIGAGFGRTGTLSMMVALDMLGFGPCYHMKRVRPEHMQKFIDAFDGKKVDWDEIFKDFNSCVDWPTTSFYKELMAKYPDAKVVLTVRDSPEKWHESAMSTIFKYPFEPLVKIVAFFTFGRNFLKMINKLIMDGTFHGQARNKEKAVAVYKQHIEEVKRVVPAERLLVFNVKEGWEPLCKFLGVPVPSEPFPRVNDREEFASRVEKQRNVGVMIFTTLITVAAVLWRYYN
ncbi:uncharacterized protein VTP21DRAFT_4162 [Calcarisporiella thermophila]|uniref:uncharacterized protein n=1 Tax=Calcarisporiella thermophila TaxID=911321 RepID=UPI003743DBAB